MLKPIFTKARLIKRNLSLAALRLEAHSHALKPGQARADLQQQQQQLQWWSSPQRHDKRVQLFALKIFTHDSVARPGQSQIQSRSQAELPQQESPHALLCPGSHVCICCTGTQITARLGVRSTVRVRATEPGQHRSQWQLQPPLRGPRCCCSIRCNIC